METNQVQKHFRAQLPEYAALMGRIIRFYEAQQDLLLSLLPFQRDATLSILDLGSGPGLLTERLRAKYPEARVTAVDLTDEMLDACRSRMGDDPLVTYRRGDFREDPLGDDLDLIVASLSLHHLRVSERPRSIRAPGPASAPVVRAIHSRSRQCSGCCETPGSGASDVHGGASTSRSSRRRNRSPESGPPYTSVDN